MRSELIKRNRKELEEKIKELKSDRKQLREESSLTEFATQVFTKGVIQGIKYSLGEIDDVYKDKWDKE